MKKSFLFLCLILILGTLACGSTAPLTVTEPVPVIDTSQTPDLSAPEPNHSPVQSPVTGQGDGTMPPVTVPSGMQVVYIREGNLWSWTEAGGNVQLTATGDMSAARMSADGQTLAFMRGPEVWRVGMDGMNARLLSTQTNEGGALWFAPGGSSLAVSTRDHIDVMNLGDGTAATVVTYPALPEGYYPEIIWSPDGMGFKTVIPPQTESSQAELLFVFTNGTVASLAKFTMASLSDSLPHISPDGGYIIYIAKLGDGKEALYLMDSSGATRPYGDPQNNIRAYGWLPDSKRFVYGGEEIPGSFIGSVSGPPAYNETVFPPTVRWVDNERYLAIENGELIMGDFDRAQILIDSPVSDFDFTP